MPHPNRDTGLTPVPVAVLLPPSQRLSSPDGSPGAWYGLDLRTTGVLVAAYTRPGDVVIDLDAHPVLAAAVRALRRHPATLHTHRHHRRRRTRSMCRTVVRRPDAGLIIASLPRPGIDADLHALTRAMQAWRSLLRPSGFLITAINRLGCHATVITAARAAGLLYHQHLLAVDTPLPEDEPRAAPDTAATAPSVLVDGRHTRVHTDLLAFVAHKPPASSDKPSDVPREPEDRSARSGSPEHGSSS